VFRVFIYFLVFQVKTWLKLGFSGFEIDQPYLYDRRLLEFGQCKLCVAWYFFKKSIKGQMTYHPPLKKIEKNKGQTLGSFSEGLGTLGLFIPRD